MDWGTLVAVLLALGGGTWLGGYLTERRWREKGQKGWAEPINSAGSFYYVVPERDYPERPQDAFDRLEARRTAVQSSN